MAGHINNLADRLNNMAEARTAVADSVRHAKQQLRGVSSELPNGYCLVDERTLNDLITAVREVYE